MHLEFLKLMKKSIGDFKSHDKSTVYLHEPHIDKSDWRFVKECLEKNFVSTVGNYVNEFEQKYKRQHLNTKKILVSRNILGRNASCNYKIKLILITIK